jgi:hypothetical protein
LPTTTKLDKRLHQNNIPINQNINFEPLTELITQES